MGDWIYAINKDGKRSSNVDRFRYFKPTKLLVIAFNNGTLYAYAKVPWKTYMGLVRAKSKGSFVQAHIVGEYNYQEILRDEAEKIGLTGKITSHK